MSFRTPVTSTFALFENVDGSLSVIESLTKSHATFLPEHDDLAKEMVDRLNIRDLATGGVA